MALEDDHLPAGPDAPPDVTAVQREWNVLFGGGALQVNRTVLEGLNPEYRPPVVREKSGYTMEPPLGAMPRPSTPAPPYLKRLVTYTPPIRNLDVLQIEWAAPAVRAHTVAVTVPLWLIGAPLTVLPLLWLRRRRRARQRVRRIADHLCPECGYDLRASPDRCPECGTVSGGSVE